MPNNDDLAWALEVHDDPYRHDPETVQKATSIVRAWRVEIKSEMRGLTRSSEEYRTKKHAEERLEAATISLQEAWMTQLSARKHGG